MIRVKTMAALAAFAGVLAASACGDEGLSGPDEEMSFSFDSSLQGWNVMGADLDNPPVDWEIAQTTEVANTGDGSVRLTLDNLNDAGKIWIVRGFDAEPGQTYQVDISFAFGTADYGSVNLWTIIAGAHGSPPDDATELDFRDNTGTGEPTDEGLVWLDKSYTSTVTADADGMLYVAIGVWGTYEVERTYFIDDVVIDLDEM